MAYQVIHFRDLVDFSDEKRKELVGYLIEHYRRATDSRRQQVDSDYDRWDRNYRAVPKESSRVTPWPNSSNVVVPIIRIFVDTHVARSLNIIFSTHPLYLVEGFPREIKDALELYMNRKALYEWDHYLLCRDMMFRGAKNGTAVVKTVWEEEDLFAAVPSSREGGSIDEQKIVSKEGPTSKVVPFEDFSVYPFTSPIQDAIIKFHRVRYTKEQALRKIREGKWQIDEKSVDMMAKLPQDIKRQSTQAQSGVVDPMTQEIHLVEATLHYPVTNDESKYFGTVVLFWPEGNAELEDTMVDGFFNPNPHSIDPYEPYVPLPREDFAYGESFCQVLEQFQEECSCIHNDRRNNSYIANSPMFYRVADTLMPNQSNVWYPGRIIDVHAKDAFGSLDIGRNYDNMIDQEMFTLQMAERLMGIGSVMQGYAQGMMGKRGIYNAQGTIALMQESNQRQNTNIRDVRRVLGRIARTCYIMQAHFNPMDHTVETFPPEIAANIKRAFELAKPDIMRRARFEVSTSNAADNRETDLQNTFNMLGVLQQHGQTVLQLAQTLANPQLDPALRMVYNDVVAMQSWIAKRVLHDLKEYETEGVIPDVRAAIESKLPGGGAGTQAARAGAGQQAMAEGGAPGAEDATGGLTLEAVEQVAGLSPNGNRG